MRGSTARQLIVAELAAPYRTRPPLVVDCSVIAAAVFAEPSSDQAWQRLAGASLHAPWLIDFEMSSVALKKALATRQEIADAGLAHFSDLAIRRHAVDVASLVSLAARHELTAYDAAYLLVASELRAPLVTFDRKLGEAAQRHLASLQ